LLSAGHSDHTVAPSPVEHLDVVTLVGAPDPPDAGFRVIRSDGFLNHLFGLVVQASIVVVDLCAGPFTVLGRVKLAIHFLSSNH